MFSITAKNGFIIIYSKELSNRKGWQFWNIKTGQASQFDIHLVEAILARFGKLYPNKT